MFFNLWLNCNLYLQSINALMQFNREIINIV